MPNNPLRAAHQPHERVRTLDSLRRTAYALDSMFEIPIVGWRFGLDAIAGLVPGIGDLTTPAFGIWALLQAFRMRVPKVVLLRMLLNIGLDALVGLVPIAGDLFDIGFKANMRNLALIERHADPLSPPTRGDYVFVGIILAIVIGLALLPIALMILLLYSLGLIDSRLF